MHELDNLECGLCTQFDQAGWCNFKLVKVAGNTRMCPAGKAWIVLREWVVWAKGTGMAPEEMAVGFPLFGDLIRASEAVLNPLKRKVVWE